jgi:hypothetical protein
MKYKVCIELKSEVEDRRPNYDGELNQTKLAITKVVEADSEKEALQTVIDLLTDVEGVEE